MMNFIELVKAVSSVDTGIFQTIVSKFFGKTQTLKVMKMYGISFRPPANAFGIAFKANGYDDETFVMVDDPINSFKNLEPGELKIGNYTTGTFIHFKSDGSIAIDSQTIVTINGSVTVVGTVTATNFISTGGAAADFNSHTHGGVDEGIGNTDGPN